MSTEFKPPTFVGFGPFYMLNDSEARLRCQPEAVPLPVFRWYHEGVEIKTGARHRVESDGTLVIFKVNKHDVGHYRCLANNFLDEANATAPAYVFGKYMEFFI